MSWCRTIAGLRVALVVNVVLLVASLVLWALDPTDWGRHALIAAAMVFAAAVDAVRLRELQREQAAPRSA